MIMVPEAYKNQPELKDKQEITDFYDYYSGLQEAWDGPALLVFSDGKKVHPHSSPAVGFGVEVCRFLNLTTASCAPLQTHHPTPYTLHPTP